MKKFTLNQHEHSHKFSTDALLLAQFAPLENVQTFVELGTGCGVVALEILKKKKNMKALALDFDTSLLQSAKENAKLYNCTENIIFVEEDLVNLPKTQSEEIKQFKNNCDLVVCNPPWLLKSQGKLPQEDMKLRALFGDENTYTLFFSSAKYFVKERGLLAFITIPQRLERVCASLTHNGFVLKKVQFVHKNKESSAIFMLALAEYKGKLVRAHISDMECLPPLFLQSES